MLLEAQVIVIGADPPVVHWLGMEYVRESSAGALHNPTAVQSGVASCPIQICEILQAMRGGGVEQGQAHLVPLGAARVVSTDGWTHAA